MEPLKECMEGESPTLPAIVGHDGSLDFSNPEDRDSINTLLADITNTNTTAPPVVYERVRAIMRDVGYTIPSVTDHVDLFTEEDGETILGLVSPQGSSESQYLYFAFSRIDNNYEIFAEVVNEAGLEELFEDDVDLA